MESSGLVGLVGLALLDSLSIGTLVIPVVMLLSPDVRPGRVLVYLGSLATFYLGVGLVLLAGAQALLPVVGEVGSSSTFLWVQLGIGALLFGASFFVGPRSRGRGEVRLPAIARWEQRLRAVDTTRGTVALALSAGLVELATMAPYLGAVGVLSTAPASSAGRGAALVGYVVVMCLPGAALLALRVRVGRRAEATLERLGSWLGTQASAAMPWLLGVLGWFIGGSAANRLFF